MLNNCFLSSAGALDFTKWTKIVISNSKKGLFLKFWASTLLKMYFISNLVKKWSKIQKKWLNFRLYKWVNIHWIITLSPDLVSLTYTATRVFDFWCGFFSFTINTQLVLWLKVGAIGLRISDPNCSPEKFTSFPKIKYLHGEDGQHAQLSIFSQPFYNETFSRLK